MLNVSKTQIMLIGTHQRLYVVDTFLVATDNARLERVDTFKYLVVTIYGRNFVVERAVSLLGKNI